MQEFVVHAGDDKQEAHGPHRSPEKSWPIQRYFSNIKFTFDFHLPHPTLGGY
jgi:hypothetical protein